MIHLELKSNHILQGEYLLLFHSRNSQQGYAWGQNKFNRLQNETKVLQTFSVTYQWKISELFLFCKNYSDCPERRRKVWRAVTVLQHTSKILCTPCKCSPGHPLHIVGEQTSIHSFCTCLKERKWYNFVKLFLVKCVSGQKIDADLTLNGFVCQLLTSSSDVNGKAD